MLPQLGVRAASEEAQLTGDARRKPISAATTAKGAA